MAKSKTEKIADIQEQITQLENQRKRLLQQQKEQERKDRTKRLCKRAGLLESLLPDTIPLSEEQFKTFLEITVLSDYSRRILDGLTVQNAATATPQTTGTAARDNLTPAANLTHTARESSEDEDTGEGNGARVTG